MKKIFVCLITIALLFSCMAIVCFADDNDVKLFCDGKEVVADVPPQIINDRMMVPLRAVFEALNATVQWDGATSTVTSVRNGITVKLTIGDPHIYVNGQAKELPVAAQIVNGRTMVPSRAIADAFGVYANWDNTVRASVFWSDVADARYEYVYTAAGVPVLIDSALENLYLSKGFLALKPASSSVELDSEQIYAKCSSAVFHIEVYDRLGQKTATGSGFFIDSIGTAITNYHVIEDAYSLKAVLPYTSAKYDIIGVHNYSVEEDWAIIKVDGSGFDYLTIGDTNTITGGAVVFAIGSPLGLQNSISQGLISNPGRVESNVVYIQTSAPISHGSSGGALLNKYGEVIGITSASYVNGQNLNLALPMYYIDLKSIRPYIPVYKATNSEVDGFASLANFIIKNGHDYDGTMFLTCPYDSNYHMSYDGEKICLYRLFDTGAQAHFYHIIIYPNGTAEYEYLRYTLKYGGDLDKLIEILTFPISMKEYTRGSVFKVGEYRYNSYYTYYNKDGLLQNAGGWVSAILDKSNATLSYYGSSLTLKEIGFSSFH